jgi:hypothetical protein
MIAVLALNYVEYRRWLAQNGLTERDARFISSPEKLLGWVPSRIERIGCWYEHPQMPEIEAAAARAALSGEPFLKG